MNDITFLVLLLVTIHFGFAAEVVNFETAFLYRELEEEIYIESPPGIKGIEKDGCIILVECFYSLVQAARKYHKKTVEIEKGGFPRGNVSP